MYKLSDHYNGKIFLNPVPTEVMKKGAFLRVMGKWFRRHPHREPQRSPGPFRADLSALQQTNAGIRVTWIGHSTVLLDIDGKRILTDPVWSRMASPFVKMGPVRFFDPPLEIDELPRIDVIVLSHDHYDHLDKHAIRKLAEKHIPIVTMLGVGDRLLKWGVDQDLVTQLDWWDHVIISDMSITATPARHFSGRWINDRFKTLWGAFAIRHGGRSVFYGADSGYYDGFKEIGERLGPFELTLLEIGAYNDDWISIHMGPEAAVQAHLDLHGGVLMPIHWGTFNLAFHPWKEPVERVQREAARKNVPLLLPAPGQTVTVMGNHNSRWWERYE